MLSVSALPKCIVLEGERMHAAYSIKVVRLDYNKLLGDSLNQFADEKNIDCNIRPWR